MAKTVKISCDNIEYSLETSKDITVLELALENDIDAPYSCQGGVCSTCLARVIKGSVKMDNNQILTCLLYTSPSPRDGLRSRMPSSG